MALVEVLLLEALKPTMPTLEQLSIECKDRFRVKISRQGLDERFHQHTVDFFYGLLKELLSKQINQTVFPMFTNKLAAVLIKDSTKFKVPEWLFEQFPGNAQGKGNCKSMVCIQYEYDVLTGKITDLSIHPGNRNDATDAEATKDNVNPNELIIRDLGYFKTTVLEHIHHKKAFFLSRLNTQKDVFYAQNNEKIDFAKLYRSMSENGQKQCEIEVKTAPESPIAFRLIVSIVPQQVYEKRIRDNAKQNKKKGHQTTQEFKNRSRFGIFITNIPTEIVSTNEVITLYKIRWQIELNFKTWKSAMNIDKTRKMKYERFVCHLIAKLMLFVLYSQVFYGLQRCCLRSKKKLLSQIKCFQTLNDKFKELLKIIKNSAKKSVRKLRRFLAVFDENHFKDKKKRNTNLIEIIELFS